jgi:hypothetical protein
MKITAKYPGTCPTCSGRFDAGETVNWAKGRKATHVVCPSAGMSYEDTDVRGHYAGPSLDVQAELAANPFTGTGPGAEEHLVDAMMSQQAGRRRCAW